MSEIDISKYRRIEFGTANLKSGCFLDSIKMLPLLIPDESKGEDLIDILDRFSYAGDEVCEQLWDIGSATVYLSDYVNDLISEVSFSGKLVIGRDINILSGAANLLSGYRVNGRTVGAIMNSLNKERVKIKGWIHFGGVGAYDYLSTVRKPAGIIVYGLDHYNIMEKGTLRNRAMYSSNVIGIVVNNFMDAFGTSAISHSQLIHLFILSAYTMYNDGDEDIKRMAEDIIYHFLWNIEQMDTYLKVLRNSDDFPVVK